MRVCIFLTTLLGVLSEFHADTVSLSLPAGVQRPWVGPEVWTNPLEDWQLRKGSVQNLVAGGDRNAVILTAELNQEEAPFTVRTRIDQQSFLLRDNGFAGIEVGIRGDFSDYRDSAIHGRGLVAGVNTKGQLFIGKPADDAETIPMPAYKILLELKAEPVGDLYRLVLRANDASGEINATCTSEGVHPSWLHGLVGVACSSQPQPEYVLSAPRPASLPKPNQKRGGTLRFAFDQIVVSGDKVDHHPERAFGPILWTTHTVTNQGDLTILVQAAAFGPREDLEATLHIADRETQYADLDPVSRTAVFRVRKWDVSKPCSYEVRLAGAKWTGTIRPAPGKDRPLVVASLSCNDATGFPHNDLVSHVKAHRPDLITFHGDQIYEAIGGFGIVVDQRPNDRANLSYLRKYAMHGWTWRDLLRDIPSITIPDDHDVFHGNIWGDGGKLADTSNGFGKDAQDSGGYKMAVEFVNGVHRTQTGNLPPPADPSPCDSGISVYFTRLQYGPFDLAILADRQFKSAPRPLLPTARIDNGWPKGLNFNPLTAADHPDAELLGRRQERFLASWASAPQSTTPFRICISQSPWLAPQTLPKEMDGDSGVPGLKVYKDGEYAPDDEPKPDFDTNGWPQSKRSAAVKLLTEAKAVHITGDQHLGTTGRYGLSSHADGAWWISSPAIANIWPRRWMPAVEGGNRRPGDPKWLGAFVDAFGNKFTLHAVANPQDIEREPARLFDRAPGYTITTWDASAGTVRLENWPYWAGPDRPAPDNAPYPGWPITVDLETLIRR
jgi:alkaline phosphatase D